MDSGSLKRQKLDYSAPTTEELINLKETALLFKSNLFKLQIDELLREVTPAAVPDIDDGRKASAPLDKYLRELKSVLVAMPSKDVTLKPKTSVLDSVRVPYLKPLTFTVKPPAKVTVVGSYLLRTIAKPVTNVDLALEMPKDSIINKDYLSFKYLTKRAAYVERVVKYLKNHPSKYYTEVRVEHFMGDLQKPIAVLKPLSGMKKPGGLAKKFARFEIRLLPGLPADAFPIRKLLPLRNCARPSGDTIKDEDDTLTSKATPLYNQRVLEDMAFVPHLKLLHKILKGAPALAQTLRLLRVWCRQRGLYYGTDAHKSTKKYGGGLDKGGGFSGFALGLVLVYLVEQRIMSRGMSVNQAFKATIRFLAERDLSQEPAYIKGAGEDGKNTVSEVLGDYTKAFAASVIGPMGVNVFCRASTESYAWLRAQAKRTLQLLTQGEDEASGAAEAEEAKEEEEDNHQEMQIEGGWGEEKKEGEGSKNVGGSAQGLADQAAFKAIFLVPVSPFRGALDAYFLISLSPTDGKTKDPLLPTLDRREARLRKVIRILRQGLSDRVRLVVAKYAQDTPPRDTKNNTELIRVGLGLAGSEAFRAIQMGPPAEEKNAARAFRAFWGERSELRRFKDGRINEAVVWSDDKPGGAILEDIALHLLKRHIKAPSVSVSLVLSQPETASLLFKKPISLLIPNPPPPPPLEDKAPGRRKRERERKRIEAARAAAKRGEDLDGIHVVTRDPLAASTALANATGEITRRLRSLKSLPLSVLSVEPTHPSLRFTDPFPPLPVSRLASFGPRIDFPNPVGGSGSSLGHMEEEESGVHDRYDARTGAPIIELILRFEASNRWPDDVVAVSRIKTAFYIQIQNALATEYYDVSASTAHDHVDAIFMGFCFRMRILYEREIAHRRTLAAAAAALARRRGESLPKIFDVKAPAAAFIRDLIARPRHHALVRGFHLKFPTYGSACRLAKRWAAAHLFLSPSPCSLKWHNAAAAAPEEEGESALGSLVGPRASALRPLARFPEEAIELIVAAAYAHPGPHDPPGSPLSGFLRFLQLLASHPWAEEPLFADLNDQMPASARSRALSRFMERRGTAGGGGGPPMYLITPEDPESEVWTGHTPDLRLLRRIQSYANASKDHLEACIAGAGELGATGKKAIAIWKTTFATPMENFDIFITVRRSALPDLAPLISLAPLSVRSSGKRKKKNGFEEIDASENPCLERALPGVDPMALLVRDLQASLGDFLEFSYDIYGATGGIMVAEWREGAKLPKQLTVATSPHSMPYNSTEGEAKGTSSKKRKRSEGYVVPNTEQIVATIKRLGEGVVECVFNGYNEFLKAKQNATKSRKRLEKKLA
ncbi:hypothetical protein AAMO2058_000718800 [Amorphochlora amoebiformis]